MVLALEARRLRPVLQALEHRQYGPALRELTAYLQKSPKSTLGNAMKCLALEGVGDSEQALRTYAYVLSLQSSDPLAPLPEDSAPSQAEETNGAPAVAEGEADEEEPPAEQGAVIKVKQPAKKPKGKGKGGKGKPKAPAGAAARTEQKHEAVMAAASRDEIYSELVLNILTRFLKSHDKLDDIATLFAKAWRFHPDEIAFGVQSFFYGGVRAGDWVQTRKIAQNLHQVTGDPKTLFWAAFAAFQQARELDLSEPGASALRDALLNMSLTIMWTYPAEPYKHVETFLLFLRVLRAAGHHTEVLRRTTSGCQAPPSEADSKRFEAWREIVLARRRADSGGKGVDAEAFWHEAVEARRKTEEAAIQKWAGDLRLQWERWEAIDELAGRDGPNAVEWDWAQEFVRAEDVIIGAEDVPNTNYKAYLSFVTCLFVLLKRQPVANGSSEAADGRNYLQDARTTLLDLAERFGSKERAPQLALLEINLRLKQTGLDADATESDATDSFALIRRYWELFGDKGCLFDDLKPYWVLLDKQALREDLLRRTGESDPTTAASVVRSINALKVANRVLFEESGSWNEPRELAKRYSAAREACKYPDTDLHPADDLRLLQVHATISASFAADKGETNALEGASESLHKLLQDSPSNGPARFLLIRLLRLLGCVNLVPEQEDGLKMRTFQHETVLHIMTDRAATFAAAGDAETEAHMREFLQHGQGVPINACAEINEALVSAFSEQSYSQIHGMLDFLQKFRASFQTILGDLEFMRYIGQLEVQMMTRSFEEAQEKTVYEATRPLDPTIDTRDWSLLPDYGPDDRTNTIKTLTSVGPITNHDWVSCMRTSWMLVNVMKSNGEVDPEPHLRAIETATTKSPGLFTKSEMVLLEYTGRLCRWMASIRNGTCDKPLAFPDLALDAERDLPWVTIQAFATQLEAFSMLEVITIGVRERAKVAKENPKGFKHIGASLTAGRRSLAKAAQQAEALSALKIPTSDSQTDYRSRMAQSRATSFTQLGKVLRLRSQEGPAMDSKA